jgi:hypothetical protein
MPSKRKASGSLRSANKRLDIGKDKRTTLDTSNLRRKKRLRDSEDDGSDLRQAKRSAPDSHEPLGSISERRDSFIDSSDETEEEIDLDRRSKKRSRDLEDDCMNSRHTKRLTHDADRLDRLDEPSKKRPMESDDSDDDPINKRLRTLNMSDYSDDNLRNKRLQISNGPSKKRSIESDDSDDDPINKRLRTLNMSDYSDDNLRNERLQISNGPSKKRSMESDYSDYDSRNKRLRSSADHRETNDGHSRKIKTCTRMRQCKTTEECLKLLKRFKTPLMVALALIDAKQEHRVELLSSFNTSVIREISMSLMKYLLDEDGYDSKSLFLNLCDSHLEAKTKTDPLNSDYTEDLKNEYESDLARFRKSGKRLRDLDINTMSAKKMKKW